MADGKKIYQIEIQGIKESYDNIKTLLDTLDKLGDTTVKVNAQEKNVANTRNSTKKATDELTKAQEKLNNFDKEYQTEVARTKNELSSKNKEIKDSIKYEQALQTIEEGVTESYRDKQQMLSAIGYVMKNMVVSNEEEAQSLENLKQRYTELNNELKEFDYSIGNYQRNVGNYKSALDGSYIDTQQFEEAAQGFKILDDGTKEYMNSMAGLRAKISDLQSELDTLDPNSERWNEVNKALQQTGVQLAELESKAEIAGNAMEAKLGVKFTTTINGVQYAFDDVNQGIGLLEDKLYSLAASGERNTEEFNAIAEAIKEMKRQVQETDEEIDKMVSGAAGIQNIVNVATTATSVMGLYQGAVALAGVENEQLAETISKLGGVMTVLNSLQELNEQITNRSTATSKLYHKALQLIGVETKNNTKATQASTAATQGLTTAQTAASAASKVLKVALASIGIGLIVAAVSYLITNWKELVTWFTDTLGITDDLKGSFEGLSGTIDKIKEVISGVGSAVVNFLLAPLKSAAALIKSLIDGDLKNALSNATKAYRESIDVVSNYQKGAEQQRTKNVENAAKKRAAAAATEANQTIAYNEAKYGSDWKYTQNGQKLYMNMFNNRLKQYKKDSDEYRQAQLDKMSYEREVTEHNKAEQERRNQAAEQARQRAAELAKQRREELKKEAEERKQQLDELKANTQKYLEETQKLYADNQSERLKNEEKHLTAIKALNQEELDFKIQKLRENNKQQQQLIEQEFQKQLQTTRDEYDKLIEEATKLYKKLNDEAKKNPSNETLKIQAEEAGNALVQLQTDRNDRLQAMQQAHNDELLQKEQEFEDKIKQMQTDLSKSMLANTKKSLDSVTKSMDDQLKNMGDVDFDNVMTGGDLFSVIDVDATKEKFEGIKQAYQTLQAQFDPNGDNMKHIYDNWQKYLEDTKSLYGEDSNEYKNALNEKDNAYKAYAQNYEMVCDQIINADTELSEIDKEFWNDLSGKITDIYNQLQEMVINPIAEAFNTILGDQLEEAQDKLDEVTELHDEAVEQVEDSNQKINDLQSQMSSASDAQKEKLRQQLADEQVLLVQRQQKEKQLNNEKVKAEQEVQKKEKQMKKVELTQQLITATVNVATGITNALSYGPILGPILAAVVAAAGAIQIASITKQISKLRKGGKVKNSGIVGEDGVSRSHEQGGHRIEDTNIEVEGGEWVVNRKSSEKYDNIIEAINDDDSNALYREVTGKFNNDYETIDNVTNEIINRIINNTNNTESVNNRNNSESVNNPYSSIVTNIGGEHNEITNNSESLFTPSGLGITNIDNRSSVTNNYFYNTNTTNNYNTKKLVSSTIRKYASGGSLNMVEASRAIEDNSDIKQIQNTMAEIDFQPVVSVVDIEKTQKNLTKVRDLAGK